MEAARHDGTIVRSDRFMVAVCTCRRSRSYPWCDTSHRRRAGAAEEEEREQEKEMKEERP